MALKSQGRSRRLDDTVLVGREPELGIVEDLFEQVSERGGALIVRGEPGIGKSALLAEASVRAEDRGMRVLTATGSDRRRRLVLPDCTSSCDRFSMVSRSSRLPSATRCWLRSG